MARYFSKKQQMARHGSANNHKGKNFNATRV